MHAELSAVLGRVGKLLRERLPHGKRLHGRATVVQGVGVAAVCAQLQAAVLALKCASIADFQGVSNINVPVVGEHIACGLYFGVFGDGGNISLGSRAVVAASDRHHQARLAAESTAGVHVCDGVAEGVGDLRTFA